MANDPHAAAKQLGVWRRFIASLAIFAEAIDTSPVELNERRIAVLERDVVLIRAELPEP